LLDPLALQERIMNPRGFLLGMGLALLVGFGRLYAPVSGADEQPAAHDLSDLLEGIRREHDLPGLAAAVVRGDRVMAEAVAGVRKLGEDAKLTLEDRFLIGSCTKPMTILMILRLIAAGKLSFETTLAEALPDVPMRDAYRRVTLAQLLTFTGGIQPYTRIGPKLTPVLFELQGSVAERRQRFVKQVLQEEPVVRPGTTKTYSNASFAVAALVASRRVGRPWEALMEQEVFQPLGMTKAGFGRPRSKERPNEPWSHIKGPDGYRPEPADRPEDPSAVLAGAGGVHCSIRDFAKFASYQLTAARGKDTLVKGATAKRWRELTRGEGVEGRPRFGGSPGISAGYLLWPSKNLGVVVAVNGGAAQDACRAVFKAVEKRYGSSAK
jgi:CubicO group peptidase (beta-lactamase class C family)